MITLTIQDIALIVTAVIVTYLIMRRPPSEGGPSPPRYMHIDPFHIRRLTDASKKEHQQRHETYLDERVDAVNQAQIARNKQQRQQVEEDWIK
jgi:hypothetical protein